MNKNKEISNSSNKKNVFGLNNISEIKTHFMKLFTMILTFNLFILVGLFLV